MFGLSTIQLTIMGVLVGAMISMGGYIAFQNWSHKQTLAVKEAKINELNTAIGVEKLAHATTQEALEQSQKAFEIVRARQAELAKRLAVTEREKDRLQKIFDKRSFEDLTIKKPGLIENRINRGTERVFNDLEELTDPENQGPE